MQKWMAVGRIDGEPREVMFGKNKVLLMWLNCVRSWSIGSDNIPVIFVGKRKRFLDNIKGKKSGCLVYVLGEIMAKRYIKKDFKVSIANVIYATSLEIWDMETMDTPLTDNKPNNELLFSEEDLLELDETNLKEED